MMPSGSRSGTSGTYMTPIKAVLFDADGVLITPPKLFSEVYAGSIGVDPASFLPFFKGVFLDALEGKADLKELISAHPEIWHWQGDPTELLQRWFDAENQVDPDLLKVVKALKSRGILVALATDQEKYRAAYLRETMFPGVMDDVFVACEFGYRKENPKYFEKVLEVLSAKGVSDPATVLYLDDSAKNIMSARNVGINAHLYENAAQAKTLLGPALIQV
jgi:putative hydrolase of the HAD superfamily